MSATNGQHNGTHVPPPTLDSLRERAERAEAEYRATLAEAKLTRARHVRRTLEHFSDPFHYGLDRWGFAGGWSSANGSAHWLPAWGAASRGDRRRGANWPLWRSETELSVIRQQSRVIAQTNPYAIGLTEGLTSYVIASGYTYRTVLTKEGEDSLKGKEGEALTDACDQVLDQFHALNEWYGGEQPAAEEEFFQRTLEDGEAFLIHFDRQGDTAVRFAEPEQVTAPPGYPDGEYDCSYGVRTPRDDAQTVLGYWCVWGDDPAGGTEYPREQVTHLRRGARRSIKRGVPCFAWGTRDALDQAARLRANMLEGGAIQAAIAGIQQFENATKDEVAALGTLDASFVVADPHTGTETPVEQYRPGTLLKMPKGQEWLSPSMWQSGNAGAFVELLQAGLRAAGCRFNAPEWLASGLHDTSSFASSLTAESPFTRLVLREQGRYKAAFVRSHEVALRNRANSARGLVTRTGRRYTHEQLTRLVRVEAEAMSPETRDKMLEAQRRQIELQSQVLSPQQWCAEEGRDYDRTVTEIEEHTERAGGAGLPLPMPVKGYSMDEIQPDESAPASPTPAATESRLEALTARVRGLAEQLQHQPAPAAPPVTPQPVVIHTPAPGVQMTEVRRDALGRIVEMRGRGGDGTLRVTRVERDDKGLVTRTHTRVEPLEVTDNAAGGQ